MHVCLCVQTHVQVNVECNCEGSSVSLEIDCRRHLGIGCIVIKLYLMMILSSEFHIIFMSQNITL